MTKENQYFPKSVPHPGLILEEKLEEMKMGPKAFAVSTGKPEQTINAILKGNSSITPDMAVLFENVTRIPAHYWMNHQLGYDEYKAREKQKEMMEAAVPWVRSFPATDMTKKGWLPKVTSWPEKAAAMLAFFGFANPKAWEDYYINQELKVAFRISLANTSDPHSISAWLRKGELQAAELSAQSYQEKIFKELLPEIKKVMARHPAKFASKLQDICLTAGVKVLYTPCLPKAPVNGCTRWLNENPLIQLSGRYKRNDIFWFTFFHEAGHILTHGKKEIFLEYIEHPALDLTKEKEADNFAIKWTLNESEYREIKEIRTLTSSHIKMFAKKFNTHPAIIIGRLRHDGLVPQTFGTKFIQPVDLM